MNPMKYYSLFGKLMLAMLIGFFFACESGKKKAGQQLDELGERGPGPQQRHGLAPRLGVEAARPHSYGRRSWCLAAIAPGQRGWDTSILL